MLAGRGCRISSNTKTLRRACAVLITFVHTAVCIKASATTPTVITPFFALPSLISITSYSIFEAFANDHITLMDVTLFPAPTATRVTTQTYPDVTATQTNTYIEPQAMGMRVCFNDHWYTHQRLGHDGDPITTHGASCTRADQGDPRWTCHTTQSWDVYITYETSSISIANTSTVLPKTTFIATDHQLEMVPKHFFRPTFEVGNSTQELDP